MPKALQLPQISAEAPAPAPATHNQAKNVLSVNVEFHTKAKSKCNKM